MTADPRGPYRQNYYPPIPTRLTKYLRTSMPWQLLRLAVINVKILKVMIRSG